MQKLCFTCRPTTIESLCWVVLRCCCRHWPKELQAAGLGVSCALGAAAGVYGVLMLQELVMQQCYCPKVRLCVFAVAVGMPLPWHSMYVCGPGVGNSNSSAALQLQQGGSGGKDPLAGAVHNADHGLVDGRMNTAAQSSFVPGT